jgi:uncharacterized protein with FMN-binding domain
MSLLTLAVVGLSVRSGAQPAASPSAEPTTRAGTTSPTTTPAVKKPPDKPPVSRSHPSTAAAVASVRGDLVDTQYGPVRVRITVSKRRITEARAIVHPQGDGTTDQINSYAVPVLNREVVAVQGPGIDTVSGATFTSDGYRQSLQSALDAAHRSGAL